MIGTGLAGGSASASLAELGYNVQTFCFQDSARRAHSIAAQGGINAARRVTEDSSDGINELFEDKCNLIERNSKDAKESEILYFISTTDNYNVFSNLKVDNETNLSVMLEV